MGGVRSVLATTAAVALLATGCADDGPAAERTGSSASGDDDATDAAPTGCDGDLVLVSSDLPEEGWEEQGEILGLTAEGEVRQLTSDGGSYGPSLSPDGSQVVYASVGPDGEVAHTTGPYGLDLWVVGADGSDPHRILDGLEDRQPDWSPDGGLIAFTRTGDDTSPQPDRIHVVAPDGTGERELVAHDGEADDAHPSWSPDGGHLAFVRRTSNRDGTGSSQLVVVTADGRDERALVDSEWMGPPTWSPDGTRIAVSALPPGADPMADGPTLLLVQVADGAIDVGPAYVESPRWASSGRLYAYAGSPAVVDSSGAWRVSEMDPDGDSFATGRAVSALDPVPFLYTDYALDVPHCLEPDASALTSAADEPDLLSVTDPSTGEPVEVLTREQAIARHDEDSGPAAGEVSTMLVYGDEATNDAICAAVGRPRPAAAVDGDDPSFGPSEIPCTQEVPAALVWLVAAAGGLTAIDAVTGRFLFGGGGPDLRLPDVADLAGR